MEKTYLIENFLQNINNTLIILNAKQEEIDLTSSSKFTTFNYMYFGENNISDMFRDLLDVKGNHGQKDLFFNLFLEVILEDYPNIKKVINNFKDIKPSVAREVRTTKIENVNRRIDLVINWNSEFAIGIENKPFDKDQENQLDDYSRHLKNDFKNNYVLIYLSDGEPTNISISDERKKELKENEKLLIIKYDDQIKKWLEKCILNCQSQRVTFFLEDLNKILNNHFMGIETENTNPLVDIVIGNDKNIEAAFEIHHAFDIVLSKVAQNLTEKLSLKFELEGYIIENNTTNDKMNFWVKNKEWPETIWCGIIDEKSDIYFSIIEEDELLFKSIAEEIHDGVINKYNWWIRPDKRFIRWQNCHKQVNLMNSDIAVEYFYNYLNELILLIDKYFSATNKTN